MPSPNNITLIKVMSDNDRIIGERVMLAYAVQRW